MRLSYGIRGYYTATVLLDGKEIETFEWADDEAGEIMITTLGRRMAFGDHSIQRRLRRGKVKILMQ